MPSLTRQLQLLLTDPKYFWILAVLVVFGDAILSELIIRFISCQSKFENEIFAEGCYRHWNWLGNIHDTCRVVSQRRARLLQDLWAHGCSGVIFFHVRGLTRFLNPSSLRYPAGHVYIFRLLHDITSAGQNIRFAQHLYALLYVVSVSLTCVIYGKAGNIPNWLLLVLPLSKRLHSLYMLRLFNDCWSVVVVQAAIIAFQNEMDDLGTLLFRYVAPEVDCRFSLTQS